MSNTVTTMGDNMNLEVVILAAGQGKRMKSRLPKVLHKLAGRSLLAHLLGRVQEILANNVHIVVGHGGDQIREAFSEEAVNWVTQTQQLGTGHAVAQAVPDIDDEAIVLVLYADVPLTSAATLAQLVAAAQQGGLALLTVEMENPQGYGRIIRDIGNRVCAIVEEKDATPEQRLVTEVNTGILAAPAHHLKRWLPALSAENAQGEYYLTDIIAMAVGDGVEVTTLNSSTTQEVQGVNSRQQLAELERWYQRQQAVALMESGVTLADPSRLDVRGSVKCGQDVFIDINVIIEGEVQLGDGVQIGPNVVLRNSNIAEGVCIDANCVVDGTVIKEGCQIGPFARLRPGTELAKNAKIGNFVETKKAVIGEGSKVNHLSYIGDSILGRDVNVGAGTITCNYDGANKHLSELGDGVFVGSNTALVAPIKVGEGVTIGAGSTVSKDIEADSLVVVRGKPRTLAGWQRPRKK